MPSKPQRNLFNTIQTPRLPRNTFDLSHTARLTGEMGELLPVLCMELVPGDSLKMRCEHVIKTSGITQPIMHEILVKTRVFTVRNDLIWPNFDKWITGKITAQAPYIGGAGSTSWGTLADYLGYGFSNQSHSQSALPVAAYALVRDEFFRSDQIQSEVWQELADGTNSWAQTLALGGPLLTTWEHDYFTACLPSPQAGAAVQIPLVAQDVDVVSKLNTENSNPNLVRQASNDALQNGDVTSTITTGVLQADTVDSYIDPNGRWEVNINATANTIQTLRRAFALQEFFERDNRGGQRYNESMRAHFDEIVSDSRLWRPELHGTFSSKMMISEVMSTADSGTATVGDYAGYMSSVSGSGMISVYSPDHQILLALMTIVPRTAYYGGIPRWLQRFDRTDYFWPTFENIGEQAVLNKELHSKSGTLEEQNDVFGYIPRYSEYKYMNDRVHGEFKHTTLQNWHLVRDWSTGSEPALNDDFVKANVSKRIYNVTSPDFHALRIYIYWEIYASRKMQVFGTPSI